MGDVIPLLQSIPDNVTAEIGPTAAWLAGTLVVFLTAVLAYMRKELQDARANCAMLQTKLDEARKEAITIRDAWDTKEAAIRQEHRQRLSDHEAVFRELMTTQVGNLQALQNMINNQSQHRHEELVAIIEAMGKQFAELAGAIRDDSQQRRKGA